MSERSFGGRYAIVERVGSGGMAEVYRARDELLGREVAVKVLSERFARDKSFVERFRREAQSAAALNHPNIVSLYDYGSDNGTYFIVMEYIDGRSLEDVVRAEGALLPERAAEIAADIAQALHRAHKAGLVHRDVKPSNVMLTSNGQIKVTDFGIARALSSNGEQTVTQTGMVIGTASYLSPEQAQGSPVDERSDVYSLGCVLYEMLTGGPPFSGESPLAIAYKHVREQAEPPSRRNPDVPRALDAIVMKAMAKNPDNRYSSALELKQDLDRFVAGQQVEATPLLADDTSEVPATQRTGVLTRDVYGEPPRRRSRWPWLIGLLLVALLAGAAWGLYSQLQSPAQQVEVPSVVGERLRAAIGILNDAGLDVDPRSRPSQRPENTVIKQDPSAQSLVKEGSTVILFVSAGPRQTEVPGVVGLTRDDARRHLADAHLELGTVSQEPNQDFRPGVVIAQDPGPNQEVPVGTTVDLTVSSGPEEVTVPFVVGLTEQEATQNIRDQGLRPEVRQGPSNDVEAGRVIAQDPTGGAEAKRGDVVVIRVSTGPEATPLPDVTGLHAQEARRQLEELGLEVDFTAETEVCVQPPNTVCRTDPESGTPVGEGDTVVLYLQRGSSGDQSD